MASDMFNSGFCSNLVFYRIGKIAWRVQLAAAFAPAIPILLFIWFCPESPRWLLKKHRYRDSFKSFCRLRNSELQAARDLVGQASIIIFFVEPLALTLCCPKTVLRIPPDRRRARGFRRHHVPPSSDRAVDYSPSSSGYTRRMHRHDGPTVQRHQHHVLLLVYHLL